MPQEVLVQPPVDIFGVLRTCPACYRLFALEPVESPAPADHPVFRCRHCDTETTSPERTPLRCV